MKYVLILLLGGACLALAFVSAWIILESRALPDIRPLTRPDASFQIEVRGWDGQTAPFTVGPGNPAWTPIDSIPDHLRKAVLAGEDFSFYSHTGVDWYEVYESFKRNFKERRFARGASTITQQLAKNLYLSREKTIRRKLRELILAARLEKTLTKDRIFELYLNIVEMGDTVYGVGQGAQHHFDKNITGISLREGALLAAMLPSPRLYDPHLNLDRVMNRSDHILGVMLKAGWIGVENYLEALVEIPHSYGSGDPAAGGGKDQEPFSQGTQEKEGTLTYEPPDPADEAGNEATSSTGSHAEDRERYNSRDGIAEIPVKGNLGFKIRH